MPSFKHIVCCLDFSSQSRAAFDQAVSQAQADGARLSLLHVLSPGRLILPDREPEKYKDLSNEQIREILQAEFDKHYLADYPGLDAQVHLRRGMPSIEIMAFAAESGADLIVLGASGFSGLGLVLLGSVAERVSRKAPCSCLVVRPQSGE